MINVLGESTGIALDIDDTLCDTARTCMEVMVGEFPTDEPFDTDLFLEKYGQPGSVPDWQVPHAQAKIESLLSDDLFLISLPPIGEALRWVPQLHQLVPITLYITSRVHARQEVTAHWLHLHRFPRAPIITRDPHETRSDWKVRYLAEHFPRINALIDNEVRASPPVSFQGYVLEVKKNNWARLLDFLRQQKIRQLAEKQK